MEITMEHTTDEADDRLTFEYRTAATHARREWERIAPDTVRHTETTRGYRPDTDEWVVLIDAERDYEVDARGRLIGTDEEWSGHGVPWKVHARNHHEVFVERWPGQTDG